MPCEACEACEVIRDQDEEKVNYQTMLFISLQAWLNPSFQVPILEWAINLIQLDNPCL